MGKNQANPKKPGSFLGIMALAPLKIRMKAKTIGTMEMTIGKKKKKTTKHHRPSMTNMSRISPKALRH